MKIHNVIQQSEEWFTLREEFPLTASKAQAIATAKGGLETLCYTKMAEKYSTAEIQRFSGKDTDRGNELEPQARTIYELKTGFTVEEAGFVTNEEVSPVGGASPDGLVGEDGLVEIKCHNDEIHFKKVDEFKETGTFTVDSKYDWQMQMQMLFTERSWCDMAIFNPNFKDSLVIVRVMADLDKQRKIIDGLRVGEGILQRIEANRNK